MGTIESWDRFDDEEVHSHRVSTRFEKAMQFFDDAIAGLEKDTSESSEATDISK